MIDPIVSAAGDAAFHRRAEAFNRRRSQLISLRDDLQSVRNWNSFERYETGFFHDKTHPPKPTAGIIREIDELTIELAEERAALVELSGRTVKP